MNTEDYLNYEYTDKNGDLVFIKHVNDDKKMVLENDRGEYNMEGVVPVLFNLPAVIASDTVYIVEGEKDAERLIRMGLTATTNYEGSGTWENHYNPIFKGKTVYVFEDNDPPGRKHAKEIIQGIVDYANEVYHVHLPGLSRGGDVSDWLDMDNTLDEPLRTARRILAPFQTFLEAEKELKGADIMNPAVLESYIARCVELSELEWGAIRKQLERHFQGQMRAIDKVYKSYVPEVPEEITDNPYTAVQNIFKNQGIFAINEMTNEISMNGEILDDVGMALLFHIPRTQGFNLSRDKMEDLTRVLASQNKYNPLKDYFSGIPEWDGEDRLTAVIDALKLRNEIEVEMMRKWFYGVIARIRHQRQNFVPYIDGKQGIGKSHWAKSICPRPVEFFVEKDVDPGNKDYMSLATTKMIWEISEFGATTNYKDESKLKAYFTTENFTFRAPYGRSNMTKPHTASYIATFNKTGVGILKDKTSNRRYVPFTSLVPDMIDFDFVEFDVDQLWSQVVHEFESSDAREPEKLSASERFYQNTVNEENVKKSVVFEYLEEFIEVDPDRCESRDWTIDVTGGGMKLKDIQRKLIEAGVPNASSARTENQIAEYMTTQLGLELGRHRRFVKSDEWREGLNKREVKPGIFRETVQTRCYCDVWLSQRGIDAIKATQDGSQVFK